MYEVIKTLEEEVSNLRDDNSSLTARAQEFEQRLTQLIEERDELLRKNESLRRGNDQYEVMCKFYRETGVGIGTCQEFIADLRRKATEMREQAIGSNSAHLFEEHAVAILMAADLAEEKLRPTNA